jgi:hypothetical protein
MVFFFLKQNCMCAHHAPKTSSRIQPNNTNATIVLREEPPARALLLAPSAHQVNTSSLVANVKSVRLASFRICWRKVVVLIVQQDSTNLKMVKHRVSLVFRVATTIKIVRAIAKIARKTNTVTKQSKHPAHLVVLEKKQTTQAVPPACLACLEKLARHVRSVKLDGIAGRTMNRTNVCCAPSDNRAVTDPRSASHAI